MIKYILEDDEYDVLDTIAYRSGMDCWFAIRREGSNEPPFSEDTYDYVYDMENHKKLSLDEGVEDLYDGMTEYKDYKLTPREIEVFENLLKLLNIERKN